MAAARPGRKRKARPRCPATGRRGLGGRRSSRHGGARRLTAAGAGTNGLPGTPTDLGLQPQSSAQLPPHESSAGAWKGAEKPLLKRSVRRMLAGPRRSCRNPTQSSGSSCRERGPSTAWPQVVAEQESKLAEQNQLISKLQETVGQLQEEVRTSRYQLHKQRQAQDAVQSQAETLQQQELQTRVALECVTSRFERYRSKIIQATFSTAGMKPPQAELTDEEVLEAMQKIINERMDFYHLLKQKGIKTPSLSSIDMSTLTPPSSKGRRKSPAR
ncbi:coiled-coil domain-containing protein 27 [Caloenas nicobarica]|uniref:coiled-coil domain-containing protein 27 n=1 Tax=Caloenas nicobarica TaxID=187106 RepID=UPI0032B7FCBD